MFYYRVYDRHMIRGINVECYHFRRVRKHTKEYDRIEEQEGEER